LHHWVVSNIESEFVAINESLWDPHPIGLSTTNSSAVNYTTLAESERGPELVEHMNTIATQLHVEYKYEPTIKMIHNYVDKKFELIIAMSRADMTLDEADNFIKSMMYTKGPNATKTSKSGLFEVKTRGKALFKNKNSFGIETNSVRKNAIRPSTARTGLSSFSGRNITTRASSRQSCNRATTASTMYRDDKKPRLFSAERKLVSVEDQLTTFSKVKLHKQASMPNMLLSNEDQAKLSRGNRKLVNKFNQFLKQNSKNTNSKSQRLAKTMRKYIQEEMK
jgi:hypothetical protein